MSKEDILALRKHHIGENLSLSYETPLQIVRGEGQFLFDERGNKYIDFVNNVAHIGHARPEIAQAASEQLSILNTNTRYLNANLGLYASELIATFPPPLEVVYFVNSGSEANDLAIRMARAFTGGSQVICMDHAYHGTTQMCIDVSPYKFRTKGGAGQKNFVHVARIPDTYRGCFRKQNPDVAVGRAYAAHVEELCSNIGRHQLAGFIVESISGCGGQIVLPPGYLSEAFRSVRACGGVCIVDEVQVGFGRVGSHMWAFQTQTEHSDRTGCIVSVVPDIVTLGKPMGNGWPLGAVVTTKSIANAFANGMEYFNTFGGSTASCVVGRTVLRLLKTLQLQQNALVVGMHLMCQLESLKVRYPKSIGDVRGKGLFVGIEMVEGDSKPTSSSKAVNIEEAPQIYIPFLKEIPDLLPPAPPPSEYKASWIVNKMKDRGVLLSTDGPLRNVIKLKPPMCITKEDIDFLVANLGECLDTLECELRAKL